MIHWKLIFNFACRMSFLAAGFVVFLIKERETNAKHLQYVSGVRYPVFWIASFLFDSLNYIIPCIIMIIVLAAFQPEEFKSADMLGYVFILLLMYGWGVIPLMYLFSFAFTIPSSGFTRMVLFNVFTGSEINTGVFHAATDFNVNFQFYRNGDHSCDINFTSSSTRIGKCSGQFGLDLHVVSELCM